MEKKEPKIKIFVAHHKPGYIYEDDVYVPIQVGKRNSKIDLGILGDDTGDNISEKNSNYAELTAQYWVWKNYDLSDVDYVGFCHYRRYMTYCYRPNIFSYIFAKNFYSPAEKKNNAILWRFTAFKDHNCLMKFNKNKLKNNSSKIKEYISKKDFDVYATKKIFMVRENVLNKLGIKHKSQLSFGAFFDESNELSDECIKLFLKECPKQKNIIQKVEKQEELRQGVRRHLFIMRKELFVKYAERLFNYLFRLEELIKNKHLDISKHWAGKSDGRFMGIFSEPMVNYWLEEYKKNNDLKISYEANSLLFTEYYI